MLFSKKKVGFSQLSQNHFISIWGYFLKISRNFTDLSKNYTLVYITGMFEALGLLVYKSDPHSKGDNSIGLLDFALGLVPV